VAVFVVIPGAAARAGVVDSSAAAIVMRDSSRNIGLTGFVICALIAAPVN